MSLLIRETILEDWKDIYNLNLQLGFEFPKEKAEEKLKSVISRSSNKVFVAEVDGHAIGYVHAGVSDRIYDEKFIFLYTIIVDKNYRGKKIGHQLIQKVEEWATESGYLGVGLWSRIDRVEAHEFYENHGYVNERTQKFFLKHL